MRPLLSFMVAALCLAGVFAANVSTVTPAPAPAPADAIPRGKILGPLTWHNQAYPSTLRHYWLYVPSQYKSTRPAALIVVQDGVQYLRAEGPTAAAAVFDELIHRKEMPVALALFVNPSFAEGETPPDAVHRETRNRPLEYEAVSDQYSRFLIEEFLPGALKGYNVTKNPAGNLIIGANAGGLAAFTAAWLHPEYFQRIIVHDAQFVNPRGGDSYAEKIKDIPRKPLRVVMQPGPASAGNPAANAPSAAAPFRRLVEALQEKNYDFRTDEPARPTDFPVRGSTLADQIRWIWRDYSPDPVALEDMPVPPSDAAFGTPGTVWELTFGGMSEPVTYEFRANGVLWWAEYQVADNYEFKDGRLVTTSRSDTGGRHRTWEIKGDTFARVIHNSLPDVELGLTARGKLKRVR